MPNTTKMDRKCRLRGAFRRAFPCPPLCEICGEKSATVLDHDHSNGLPRGWVCVGCNNLLAGIDAVGGEVNVRVAEWKAVIAAAESRIRRAPAAATYLERANGRWQVVA